MIRHLEGERKKEREKIFLNDMTSGKRKKERKRKSF